MLTVGKITEGRRAYFDDQVARSAEEYYSGRGEADATWMGGGATEFDLEGKVGKDAFNDILDGKNPETHAALSSSYSRRKILAFDLTFSAPKSVSVMLVLGREEVRDQVRQAHDQAVLEGLAYMEEVAGFGREGAGGKHKVEGDGFVSAAYRHRTSREGDPQLHTHVVTGNMIKTKHGRWVSLDSGRLYEQARTGGFIYQAALRRELTRRLGVEWRPVVNGAADVKGIPQEALDQFSKRRQQVVDAMKKAGGESRAAGQVAALTTRKSKKSVSQESLYDRWAEEGEEVGVTVEAIDAVCGQANLKKLTKTEAEKIEKKLSSPTGMTLERATFDRRGVIQAVCENAPATCGVDAIERLADTWLDDHALPVIRPRSAEDRVHEPQRIKRVGRAGETIFTTPAMAKLERDVSAAAIARRDTGAGLVDERVLDFALTTGIGATLDDEQREAVEHVVRSGDGVSVIIGEAGTGKTYALSALRRTYENAGYRIVGGALAARAAIELEEGSGIESGTIASLLMELDGQGVDSIARRKTVLVVDESSMVGTRDLGRLLAHAESAGAKVVLVGDDGQLPSIDAGGVFRGLAERLGSARLQKNRRQRDPVEREIVQLFRNGYAQDALTACATHGRLVVGETPEETRAAMVGGWYLAHEHSDSRMIAERRSDVQQLNVMAQATRYANGEIDGEGLVAGYYEYVVGDRILCRHNNKRLHVINGDYGEVLSFDKAKGSIVIAKDDGEVVELPRWYVDDPESFQLGYAITIHTAEGATFDDNHVLGSDRLYREAAYTAMTRGRDQNMMYVTVGDLELAEAGYEPDKEVDPLDAFRRALARSEAQIMAIDVGTPGRFAETTTQTLAERVAEIRDELGPPPELDHDRMDEVAEQRRAIQSQMRNAEARSAAARLMQKDEHALFEDKELEETIRTEEATIAKLEKEREALKPAEAAIKRDVERERAWLHNHRDELDELHAYSKELERRIAAQIRTVENDVPEYLVRSIGDRPESPLARTQWRRAAYAIELYRARWEVTSPTSAIGPPPRDLEQIREQRELQAEIERARERVLTAPQRIVGRTL